MKRLQSVDFTRGLVMIIMALDHARDLIHIPSISQSPTDLTTTTPVLFFTRWITYLCAPTFVFLAGTSVYLSLHRAGDLNATRRFLLKRGIYLILLEFTVVSFGLFFDPLFHTNIFEVIATIGFGFIVLASMLHLPAKALGVIGLAIIFCHNLFSLLPFPNTSLIKELASPLFIQTTYPFSGRVLVIGYPPIPWLGVMLVGFAAGQAFALPEVRRIRMFLKTGLTAIVLFGIIRFINIYGDTSPWSTQKSAVFTFLSFMNVTKYPPSLLFCLITLGTMFLILAFAEGKNSRLISIVSVYGKVPLFYFLIHFFLIHFILLGILLLQGFHWSQLAFSSGTFGRPTGVPSGLPLWAIYLVWIAVVVVLYKPCQWFGRYKSTHSQWWLKYL